MSEEASKAIIFGHSRRLLLWILAIVDAGLLIGADVLAAYRHSPALAVVVGMNGVLLQAFPLSVLLFRSGMRKAAAWIVVGGTLLFLAQLVYGCALEILKG